MARKEEEYQSPEHRCVGGAGGALNSLTHPSSVAHSAWSHADLSQHALS